MLMADSDDAQSEMPPVAEFARMMAKLTRASSEVDESDESITLYVPPEGEADD
jgi:hypothetical protein